MIYSQTSVVIAGATVFTLVLSLSPIFLVNDQQCTFGEKLRSFKVLSSVAKFNAMLCIFALGSDFVSALLTNSRFFDWGTASTAFHLLSSFFRAADYERVNLTVFLCLAACIRISVVFGLAEYCVEFSRRKDDFRDKRMYYVLFAVCAECSIVLTHYQSLNVIPAVFLPYYRPLKLVIALSWFLPFAYISSLWRMILYPLKKATYENIDPVLLYLFGIIAVLGISAVGIMWPSLGISADTPEHVFVSLDLLNSASLFLIREFRAYVDAKVTKQLIKSFLPKRLYRTLMSKAKAARSDGDEFTSPASLLVPETRTCAVIFIDIVKSMDIARECSSAEWKKFLHSVFTVIDACAERHGVVKIETIGDCHLSTCGLIEEEEETQDEGGGAARVPDFPKRTALFALSVLEEVKKVRTNQGKPVEVRIGFDLGEVSHSMTPGRGSRWAIYGDTVNRASRMQSTSLPSKIQCSASFAALLLLSGFHLASLGVHEVKGIGHDVETFWLVGEGGGKEERDDKIVASALAGPGGVA